MDWRIGRIKFFSKKDNFGFVYDNMYVQSSNQEFYFDCIICDGYLYKTDEVVFYKTKLDGKKEKVSQILPVRKDFYEMLIDDLDLNAKIDCFRVIENSYIESIEDIFKNFEGQIKKIEKQEFFKPVVLDIRNYLKDFNIKLNIYNYNKVGDDQYLHISYEVINPHFEFVNIPGFSSTIIKERGMGYVSAILEDFIVNKKIEMEKKIPKMLIELKKHLASNYYVLKGKKYRGYFHMSFKDRLKWSIQFNGLRKTKENQNEIFEDFYRQLVNGVGFNDFMHLVKIEQKNPSANVHKI